jgi:hypothetical protein
MNWKWHGRKWSWPNFSYYLDICLKEHSENKIVKQARRSADRHVNAGLPEYEAEVPDRDVQSVAPSATWHTQICSCRALRYCIDRNVTHPMVGLLHSLLLTKRTTITYNRCTICERHLLSGMNSHDW